MPETIENPWRPSHPVTVNPDVQDLDFLKELLHFDGWMELQEWMDSAAVAPFFNEFVICYIRDHIGPEEAPDLNIIMSTIRDNELPNGGNRYSEYYIDKSRWRTRHHHARFLVQVYQYAKDNPGGPWTGYEEEDPYDWGCHLEEVLLYLIKKWKVQNLSPELC